MSAVSTDSTPRRSGVVTPHRAAWHQRLMARLIYVVVQTLDASLRFRVLDPAGVFNQTGGERMIFAIWHNRLALSLSTYNRYVRRRDPSRRMAAMVSASRDGGMLARVLELFEVQPVRGSTSRRGPQALRELTGWAERGYDLAITPDGPRGPCYQVQEGVISLAQLTGLPIVPASPGLEVSVAELGSVPITPAVRPLRGSPGRTAAGFTRHHRGGARDPAKAIGTGVARPHHRLARRRLRPYAIGGGLTPC
jgi:lysophospholipid acyltransferase (LPLAT)-like uncharacterized protein